MHPSERASWSGCAWAVPLLLALAACTPLRSESGGPVEVSELRHASICNSRSGAAAVTILRDAEALRDWQAARQIDLIGAEPLPPGPYALVEHGQRSAGGYAVIVNRHAVASARVLTLYASFLAPATNTLRPEQPTSPCALIGLPPGNYDLVELIDTRHRRRAVSTAGPAPVQAAAPAAVAPAP